MRRGWDEYEISRLDVVRTTFLHFQIQEGLQPIQFDKVLDKVSDKGPEIRVSGLEYEALLQIRSGLTSLLRRLVE